MILKFARLAPAFILVGTIFLLPGLAHGKAKATPQATPYKDDLMMLPIAEPNILHSKVFDARNAKAPPQF